MVGIPLAVVLAVLEAGKGLTAPPPVSGEWRLEPGLSAAPGSCPLEPVFGSGAFTLTQAGRYLTLKGARTLYGRMEQSGLRLESGVPGGPVVAARLLHAPGAVRVEGSVAGTGGATCTPASFSARLATSALRTAAPAGSH